MLTWQTDRQTPDSAPVEIPVACSILAEAGLSSPCWVPCMVLPAHPPTHPPIGWLGSWPHRVLCGEMSWRRTSLPAQPLSSRSPGMLPVGLSPHFELLPCFSPYQVLTNEGYLPLFDTAEQIWLWVGDVRAPRAGGL